MPDVEWIWKEETQTKGISKHILNLHVAENTSFDNRTAIVRLYDENSDISEDIVINQSQLNAINLETEEFDFNENGGTFTVHLNANVDYEVRILDEWVTEEVSAGTRSLVARSHVFNVAPLIGSDRTTKIIFADAVTGTTAEVCVKQYSSIFFKNEYYSMMLNSTLKLELTNRTEQAVSFTSSDETIATVDESGVVKALSVGNVVITAMTGDGIHKCSCNVSVHDITDYISAMFIGGSIVNINGHIKSGSKLNWRFMNNSNGSVNLKTLQLIGGNGYEGNVMEVNAPVSASSSKSYSITIGLLGIYTPVTCRFTYEYEGKEYFVDAIYD